MVAVKSSKSVVRCYRYSNRPALGVSFPSAKKFRFRLATPCGRLDAGATMGHFSMHPKPIPVKSRAVRLRSSGLSAITLCLAVFVANDVNAHGGVSIEDDNCIVTIGPYRAHFSGYQPKLRASKEFCEDIPVVADAIIVLDFISLPLRNMQVDFRVIRDVNEIGVTATYDDLGSAADIAAATLVYREAQRYGNGNFDVSLRFDTAGDFIGVMTATNPDDGKAYVSVFPFSVGKSSLWGLLKWVIAVLALGVAAYFLSPKAGQQTSNAP